MGFEKMKSPILKGVPLMQKTDILLFSTQAVK